MPTSPSGDVRLALTLGDPAGIGPEVLVKALRQFKKKSPSKILLIAPAFYLNSTARKFKIPIKFIDIPDLNQWPKTSNAYFCYFPEKISHAPAVGKFQKDLTTQAVLSITTATQLALKGFVDGIVTAPINKTGLKKAGFDIPGHTEYLAKLSKVTKFEMMLVGGPLRVVLVTRHEAITNVAKKLTIAAVMNTILTTYQELQNSFGIKKPRIVVCGLNPHAGENGTIGTEEINIIEPAVRKAEKILKIKITGPLSPDTVFYAAYEGRYDAEICMYHDQGLIPLKMISRGRGVNVTLGLPFVRTSPDHGTAYDIAGKGVADPGSMFRAIELAFKISRNRKLRASKK